MSIYPHSNESETQWGRGNLQVMIKTERMDKPVAYCDGTKADEQELISQAESEGLSNVTIQKKTLKTGREIWTVTGDGGYEDVTPDEF